MQSTCLKHQITDEEQAAFERDGYFTDTTETGRGNLHVLPGSHLQDEFPGQDRKAIIDGGV
ncbi:MAG: hypothetical protein QF689_13325, partial [Candidatus Latescibacteria bacterium]|nr:hypothetical protein [Candidatus Latescibacterota bacterium]